MTKFRNFMSGFQTEVLVPESVSDDDDRRNDLRHGSRQHVSIQFRSLSLICDLVDLSEFGAKISVGDGIVPDVGESVALTLFDGTAIDGRVSWLRDKHLGVEFQQLVPDVEEHLDFENLGREFFGKAVTLQKATRRS
jgi:PilZ domain